LLQLVQALKYENFEEIKLAYEQEKKEYVLEEKALEKERYLSFIFQIFISKCLIILSKFKGKEALHQKYCQSLRKLKILAMSPRKVTQVIMR
jgi:hypothetical protein